MPLTAFDTSGTPTTTLLLVRHAATEANLCQPPRIQGQSHNPPLAPLGVQQAETTRDFLASWPIRHCYTSPLLRAIQTAAILSKPHMIEPTALKALTEADVGQWEGLDWPTVQYLDPDGFRHFHANPAQFGYPGGESFADAHARASPALNRLFNLHPGETILVVSHHIVLRTFLATLLGLPLSQARKVQLHNASVSVVERNADHSTISVLNSIRHLPCINHS